MLFNSEGMLIPLQNLQVHTFIVIHHRSIRERRADGSCHEDIYYFFESKKYRSVKEVGRLQNRADDDDDDDYDDDENYMNNCR